MRTWTAVPTATWPDPTMSVLLADLDRRTVGGVLVWKIDRLVRRPAEFERFWARCEGAGAMLASVCDPIDTTNEIGLAIVRILVTFAGLESATTSLRLRAMERERAVAGMPPHGPRPYGLTANWKKIVPKEAALIREAADRLLAGDGLGTIVEDWRDRKIPAQRGGPWTRQSLEQMLTSRRLAAERVYHGEVVAVGRWPAILDPLTAARVREILSYRSRRSRSYRGGTLLGGYLRCGRCGGQLCGGGQRERPNYQCKRRPYGCGGLAITAEVVEPAVVEAVLARLDSGDLEAVAPEHLPPDAFQIAVDHREALNKLAGDYYTRRELTEAEYRSARATLARELERDRARILPAWRFGVLRALGDCSPHDKWSAMSIDRQRALIGTVVDHVTIKPSDGRGPAATARRLSFVWADPR